MVGTTSNWEDELRGWLKPFLDRLGHKSRRRMCPLYVAGLIGPGDRKSVQPMAERLAPGDYDQLHHFVAAGVWDAARHWRQSCSFKRIGSLVAATPCW
jgi:SRSO17 transposase